MAGVHGWHLCIDKIHVEDVITVSRAAVAVGVCATWCRHPMPLANGADVEALAQRLEQYQDTYHAANQATVVFLASAYRGGVLCHPCVDHPLARQVQDRALPCCAVTHGRALRQCCISGPPRFTPIRRCGPRCTAVARDAGCAVC